MTPQDVVNNLRTSNTAAGALSLAEGIYKKLKEMRITDLPDLISIANDSHVSDSMKKGLVRREKNKIREVEYEIAFWQNVAGILRKQVKA